MLRRINVDWPLVGAAFALTAFGIAMVYSAGAQSSGTLDGMWSDPPDTPEDSFCFGYCTNAGLEKLKAKPILVVCQTGSRSGQAAGSLQKQGFADVVTLSGGMEAWQKAGMPLEKDA